MHWTYLPIPAKPVRTRPDSGRIGMHVSAIRLLKAGVMRLLERFLAAAHESRRRRAGRLLHEYRHLDGGADALTPSAHRPVPLGRSNWNWLPRPRSGVVP